MLKGQHPVVGLVHFIFGARAPDLELPGPLGVFSAVFFQINLFITFQNYSGSYTLRPENLANVLKAYHSWGHYETLAAPDIALGKKNNC